MPEVHILYYSPTVNRFADENWCIIHDLHKLFYTWQLAKWKKTFEDGILVAKNGDPWKLYFLTEDENDDTYDIIGWNIADGVQKDRIYI